MRGNNMKDFQPFANTTQSISVGPDAGLTFENNNDSINVYGDITITKNTEGHQIQELIEMLQKIQSILDNKQV